MKDDDEAEDVMQQAYVNAYLHLDQFAQRASFSTWLTKIAVSRAKSDRGLENVSIRGLSRAGETAPKGAAPWKKGSEAWT